MTLQEWGLWHCRRGSAWHCREWSCAALQERVCVALQERVCAALQERLCVALNATLHTRHSQHLHLYTSFRTRHYPIGTVSWKRVVINGTVNIRGVVSRNTGEFFTVLSHA